MINRKLLLTLGAGLIFSLSCAAEDGSGQAGAYLKMGVGARALGMGGAFSAIADDATASFWNPAGLSQLSSSEIDTMHTVLKMDRTYNFINYVQPDKKRKSSWGVAYTRFGVDDLAETHIWRYKDAADKAANIIRRDLVYGEAVTTNDGKVLPVLKGDAAFDAQFKNVYTGNCSYNDWKTWRAGAGINEDIDVFSVFNDTEWAFAVSYAQQMNNPKCLLGANLKYLKQDLFTYSADSWSWDLGMLYKATPKFNYALTFKDLAAGLKWDTPSGTEDKIPVTSTLGLAYFPNKSINVALDYSKVQNGEGSLHFGVEGFIKDKFGLRAGDDDGDFTMGASFKSNAWRFDYAFRDQTLGNEHRMSANYRF
ncbi:MAG: UPF0164 family protein [Candidatus Wallbacteria bacterium]|nr:UPF0164 family protein [Candidatus Wallbacteria bacterium]